ncbi:hypothetical protein ASPZODRAFT_55735 [Penicilliopsis zonata CBS 506.65]|uniref:SNF7 family protein n=1 Tax=Penicilliopsis zonata CBS 506.65 TaxID=1073090 RepID=A0A1L9SVM0_9EURO|nr:hypothetical protein ASPZODRAFT_55735 [Penicilliopsis zonata CBS 506.65]OJJ51250.1 hypothetical protein ASPZODRAFT_55735 [Penicilliopsis zonata CBS 506.65]
MSDLIDYILKHEDAFRRNRLPSLYSDFALQKTTNPDGYAINIAAWERAISCAARKGLIASDRKGDHLVLRTSDALLRQLELPDLGRPVALGAVFEEAIRNQAMVPLQAYRASATSLHKKQWSVLDTSALSPWSIMSWGARQLKGIVLGADSLEASPRLQTQDLVIVENLQEAASKITKEALSRSSSKIDLIYSKEGFINEFKSILDGESSLSDLDFDVLLLYLSRDTGAIAYDGKTIKFMSSDDTRTQITQQDTTIASIRTLISTMSKQVGELEAKIEGLTTAAKAALNSKNRISALSSLRSKKLIEHNLKQRLDTLAQLEEVYTKIEQAADQVEVMKVMEASTGVLRGLHSQLGGIERVEDVVEELREEMMKVDEVGSILNEAGPIIDEGEIDEELEALEKRETEAIEEAKAQETRKRLAELDSDLLRPATKEAAKKAATEQSTDAALAESIDRLSQMSVEDASEEGNGTVPLPAK